MKYLNFYKNVKSTLTLALAAIMSVCCSDFLETSSKSKFTEESVFENIDFATKELFGAYQMLTTGNWWDYNLLWFMVDTDVEVSFQNYDGARNDASHYRANPGTNLLQQTWTSIYQTIERVNLSIDNLPDSKLWNGEYSVEAKRLYAEAVTLRAYCYYLLIGLWGDVPFQVHATHADDNFYIPKTERDDIYEVLVKDLKDVQDYLPWQTDVATTRRISKGVCKGLRAKIAMMYAGYSCRNKTFETRRGRHWKEYLSIANQECKELMESGKHRLSPDFEQMFRDMHAYKQDVLYGDVMWEVAYGRSISGRVAQSLGMPHTTNPEEPKYGRAAGEFRLTALYYYTFDKSDKRRDISAALYNYNSASYPGQQRLIGSTSFAPTKWRRSWIVPSMGGDLKNVQFTGVGFPLLRYTDIVLLFAETENEINNAPTPAAKAALASVRQRAFPEDTWQQTVNEYIDSVSVSKEDFFFALVNERSWEFCGEFVRKFDLIRWNLLGWAKDKMITMTDRMLRHPNEPPFNWVPSYLYWRILPDGETIDILNPDYRLPSQTIAGYTRTTWFGAYNESSITSYYTNFDRVMNGYRKSLNNYLFPIASNVIDASRGILENDQWRPYDSASE
ncbi:MAG: RagB/SusD family nutrient uptake outer membrane protein [Tannerella sp.]|jgi:hypothetical protein|nr:RagB/SusD family nutrient uptake outer membrane protein [Tannerella sp.]